MSNPDTHPARRTGFRLSQESVVVITAAVALAGLMLTITADIREEGRADRAAWQAESRHLRDQASAERAAMSERSQAERAAMSKRSAERAAMTERTQAALDALGARAQADREAFAAEMRKLQEQVVGLSTKQAALAATVQASR